MKKAKLAIVLVLVLTTLLTIVPIASAERLTYRYGNGDLWLYSFSAESNAYASVGGTESSANIYVRIKARNTGLGGFIAGNAYVAAYKSKWGFPMAAEDVYFCGGSTSWVQDTDTESRYNLGQNYIWVKTGLLSVTIEELMCPVTLPPGQPQWFKVTF